MSPHNCKRFDPNCYRCDLGRDEALSSLQYAIEDLESVLVESLAAIKETRSFLGGIPNDGRIRILDCLALGRLEAKLALLEKRLEFEVGE